MEIITAIGFILVANSISSPSWWVMILEILFVLFSVAIGSLGVTNSMHKMRDNIRKEIERKAEKVERKAGKK